jgi:hypothetical protein
MPHTWNGKIVVTKDELVPAWFNTWNALKLALYRYQDKPYGIKRARRGGKGHDLLIDFDTLDSHIRESLGDPRKISNPLELFFKLNNEATAYYQRFTFDDGSLLKTEQQEKYIINASVLTAVIKLREARIQERKNKNGSLRKTYVNGQLSVESVTNTLWSDAICFQKCLQSKHKLTHTLPESRDRFLKTLKEFERNGFISLISGKHKNQNTRKVTDDTLGLLNALFATDRTKPTAKDIDRRYNGFINGIVEVINNATGELYNPGDFKNLSDSTVRKYLSSWASKIGTYQLRGGDRQKLMQQFKPYHSLNKPKYAGSIISIDDRQPPFKTPDGKRVWFYNGIDLASEAFTCWVYGDTKEGIIKEFYRELVRNYTVWGFNLPAELEAEMSLNSSYTTTFLREGVMFDHVRIEANNARGKRIERYFKSLRYGLEKERDGWLACMLWRC